MPVTKKVEVNKYFEDFEEIDEHSPLFEPNYLKEEKNFFEEKAKPIIPFWEKCGVLLKSFFSKL